MSRKGIVTEWWVGHKMLKTKRNVLKYLLRADEEKVTLEETYYGMYAKVTEYVFSNGKLTRLKRKFKVHISKVDKKSCAYERKRRNILQDMITNGINQRNASAFRRLYKKVGYKECVKSSGCSCTLKEMLDDHNYFRINEEELMYSVLRYLKLQGL